MLSKAVAIVSGTHWLTEKGRTDERVLVMRCFNLLISPFREINDLQLCCRNAYNNGYLKNNREHLINAALDLDQINLLLKTKAAIYGRNVFEPLSIALITQVIADSKMLKIESIPVEHLFAVHLYTSRNLEVLKMNSNELNRSKLRRSSKTRLYEGLDNLGQWICERLVPIIKLGRIEPRDPFEWWGSQWKIWPRMKKKKIIPDFGMLCVTDLKPRNVCSSHNGDAGTHFTAQLIILRKITLVCHETLLRYTTHAWHFRLWYKSFTNSCLFHSRSWLLKQPGAA